MDTLITSLGCFGPAALFVVIYLFSCLKVVNEYERLVVFTLSCSAIACNSVRSLDSSTERPS